MSEPRVIRREEVESLQRAPGVSVASSVTKEVGATEISSGITTFQAGWSNTTHYHNAEESVIVMEGEGILMINGEENHLRQYDAALITPGTHHRLINTGEIPFKIASSYATVDVTRTLVD
jgi:quercetin dioxygenase-like cupin family protein